MFSHYSDGGNMMNLTLKQTEKLTMPRHKKGFYGFYAIAMITIVVLSLVL
ncbi:MAG: hypothetical protein ACE5RL_07770 [Nitrosarchaeum sp.]